MAQIRELQTKRIPCPMQESFTILNQEGALERPTFPIELLPFCPRTLPRCDFGLPRDTLNGTGTTRNVFELPPAQQGLPSTIFNNSKNSASSSQGYHRDSSEREWNEKKIFENDHSITSLPKVEVDC